jgi:hypothetical protein
VSAFRPLPGAVSPLARLAHVAGVYRVRGRSSKAATDNRPRRSRRDGHFVCQQQAATDAPPADNTRGGQQAPAGNKRGPRRTRGDEGEVAPARGRRDSRAAIGMPRWTLKTASGCRTGAAEPPAQARRAGAARRGARRSSPTMRCGRHGADTERATYATRGTRYRAPPSLETGGYLVKKNCSGRALPGLRSGQSFPSVVGTLRKRGFTTTTPWIMGVRPIVPIS